MTTTANAPPDGPSAAPPLKSCSIAEIGAIAHLMVFAAVTLRLDERSWSQRQSLIAIG
jgi:hypothetical protein